MAKSLDDIFRRMEQERLQKLQQEQALRERNERARQEWVKSNDIINERASTINTSSSSSAGGGILRPTPTIPILEITSFNFSDFVPTISSITINISSGGHSPINSRGVVYSGDPSPILGVSPSYTEIDADTGTGEFTMTNINVHSDMIGEVTYLRAYATNEVGTGYSATVSWTPNICLAKGTQIMMSNGETKNIEDVVYEDELLVWNFDDGNFDAAKPMWIKRGEFTNRFNLLKFSDGSELKTISQHRIFNKEAGKFTYPMTDETPIGTTTFNKHGKEIKLIEKSFVDEEVEYFNVISDRHMNLFANGILTSCRYNNIYPIENMKFTKEERSRDMNEFSNIPEKYINGLRLSEQTFSIKSIEFYVNRLIEHEVCLQEV